jgi:hypothetical protein
MERVMRIELTSSAWKAEVLPLNYTRTKSLYTKVEELKHYYYNTKFFPYRQENFAFFVEKKSLNKKTSDWTFMFNDMPVQ